ncbi:MAG: alanine racemase, partial [Bacteroidota bacterium]
VTLHCETAQTLLYALEDENAVQLAQKFQGKRHFTWTIHANSKADLQILERKSQATTTHIKAVFQGKIISVILPFVEEELLEKALYAWAMLLCLGESAAQITTKFQQLENISTRLEMRPGIHQSSVVVDYYNGADTSLTPAFHFLAQQTYQTKRSLILLNYAIRSEYHPHFAREITSRSIERIIFIGQQPTALLNFLYSQRIKVYYFKNTIAFLAYFKHSDFKQEAILIKGGTPEERKPVLHFLSEKVHRTILEVDLDAVRHNLNQFRAHLRPTTKMAVMVKAAAYGSGSAEIGRFLAHENVDYLAVAYADEGVELRKAGIQCPIMVLNPELATFETHLRYALEPEIYSLQQLQKFIAILPEKAQLNIHLKLDTGMHRLGFEERDLPALLHLLTSDRRLHVVSIFTHLAASDEAQHENFTETQVQRYLRLYDKIVVSLPYRPMRHVLNTSGIVRFPQYQFDMVRLGIGLYSAEMSDTIQSNLRPMSSLKARISQIKSIEPTETVGYGRKGTVQRPTQSATISIGYADGFPRLAGNGRYDILVRGKRAPILGNICMDMCMLDVTDIPEAQEGDEVTVFGQEPSVHELAKVLQTIPYEVFTNIAHRVHRVYYQN